MKRRAGGTSAPQGGDPDWHFLEARRLQESGRVRLAMEEAGFGIRLALDRPEGYLLLGELNLEDGDLVEARRSFRAAAARAQGDFLLMALAGSIQVAVIEGDLADARELHEKALRADGSDPLNLRPAFVEILLALDDLRGAAKQLAECADESVDLHLVGAIVQWRLGDASAAAECARRACLENVYLAARLAGDDVPDTEIVHGIEEATPAHAEALLDRVAPLVTAGRGTAEFLEAVAASDEARHERSELLRIARGLQAESRPAERAGLKEALMVIRDPTRIARTTGSLVEAIRRSQPALFASSPFDV